jgi:hypothetical protein
VAEPALLIAVGCAAGLAGAAFGVGGGFVIVPVLHLGLHVPLPIAVGTSLLVITGTSLAGTSGYLKRRLVLIDVALELQLGALAGGLAAAWAAARIPERAVAVVFAGALTWSAILLLWRRRPSGGAEAPAEGPRRWLARGLAPLGGMAAGLLGIGGGQVQVPILRLALGVEIRRAIATSTLMVGLTASTAAAVYLGRGEADLGQAPWLLAGVLAGAVLAPRLGGHLPRRALEVGFALAALYGAFRMVAG